MVLGNIKEDVMLFSVGDMEKATVLFFFTSALEVSSDLKDVSGQQNLLCLC